MWKSPIQHPHSVFCAHRACAEGCVLKRLTIEFASYTKLCQNTHLGEYPWKKLSGMSPSMSKANLHPCTKCLISRAHLFKQHVFIVFFWHDEQECKLKGNHSCTEIQNKSWRQTHEGIQKYFIDCPLFVIIYWRAQVIIQVRYSILKQLQVLASGFSLTKICMMF